MIKLGIDRLIRDETHLIRGKKVGLLLHAASVTSGLVPTLEAIRALKTVEVVRLFGPEHGIYGSAQDMVPVESSGESISACSIPIASIPTVSLYGTNVDSLRPKITDLVGLDCLICDLQDIGTRYYTYIYTLVHCLEACAQAGVAVIVCDRPNPINGLDREGRMQQPGYESFVGLHPLPVRHGLTIGELAQYFNETLKINCNLKVIPMEGWKRSFYFEDTGLCWINPSPNMPSPVTALIYPGCCLIEATQLSEGRGTTRPFECIGAPRVNGRVVAEQLNRKKLPGVYFRETAFEPTNQKHAGKLCGGIQIHVTNRNQLAPYEMGLHILKVFHDHEPESFAWRNQPYEFVTTIPAIDLLTGSASFRESLDQDPTVDDFSEWTQTGLTEFAEVVHPFLLYE